MRSLLTGLFAFLIWNGGQHRDPLQYIEILESADRVQKLQVERVVDQLEIASGAAVADLGSGSGLFTRPLARRVGEAGKVFAIDVDPDLLSHVEKTAARENLTNIVTVLAGEADPRIPEPVELILVVDTLHHIQARAHYIRNLRRYLRPGGRVAVIDFSDNWPARHEGMRYDLSELEGWMSAAGFKRLAHYDYLEGNFFVVYGIDPEPGSARQGARELPAEPGF